MTIVKLVNVCVKVNVEGLDTTTTYISPLFWKIHLFANNCV